MRHRLGERTWRLTAAAVSLAAAAMALYVQLFEVRLRQEESQLAALRLENALAVSRSRLKAEILAELRAGNGGSAADGPATPVPGAVLRRSASRGSSGTDRPALESTLPSPPLTLSGLAWSLEELSQHTGETDRALRRDLEELRVATRRELDAGEKVTAFTLISVIPLAVLLLLLTLRQSGQRGGDT